MDIHHDGGTITDHDSGNCVPCARGHGGPAADIAALVKRIEPDSRNAVADFAEPNIEATKSVS